MTRLYCTHCCQWRRSREAGAIAHTKFLAVGKLSEIFLLSENWRPKIQNLALKNHVLEKLSDKVEILSTHNLSQLSVEMLSEICSVYWKIATSCPPTFLTHDAADCCSVLGAIDVKTFQKKIKNVKKRKNVAGIKNIKNVY